ncbi:hypothetical protein B0H67DRAFT_602799 [Lasiosphaeris hirsuta]|uniref:Uncharacterized protein n=1 Tax=Lasiosphaeris hirsuta TaxID=260670 RepID=A0AA40DNM6_9PEZI|nr:hypothetical protein B0H67DRAFT_602799 [Lasiosphaeris hirsuta]
MMEVTVATPSPGPSSAIHTPPAPLHGFSDSWEPYSPRKSARISQRAANRTPSPHSSRHHDPRNHSLGSPKSTKNQRTSVMASPVTSPRKKRFPNMESSRRASGSITAEAAAAAASSLGLFGQPELQPSRASISATGGMLITPAKTPQKAPTQQSKDKIKSIARSLFNESEVMPSPKKARTKYTLDSFSAQEEEKIEIYTDSHERIPEVDRSANNPFYGNQSAPAPELRRSKRETITIPGGGKVTVQEAARREDGIVTVFRGKKVFRKFADLGDANETNLDGSDEADVEPRLRRPLTRSAIKPRLLFPPKAEVPKIEIDDEEAVTDIEDHILAGAEENGPSTPMELVDDAPGTPDAPKFAPASPPTTARATRFGKFSDSTPVKPKGTARGSKKSPFDGWRRNKSSSSSDSHSLKRPNEAGPSNPAKRPRV